MTRLAEAILLADVDRASGVVQDAWLLASQRLATFESVDHLARWTYCVCRRRAISILRRERSAFTVAWADEPGDHRSVASPASPTVEVLDKETMNSVHAAIARLPDTQRGVVTLYYIHGYGLAQVALLLRLRVCTVKMRLHRARQRLRFELRDCAPS